MYINNVSEIGFEKESDTWLRAYDDEGGIYIDAAYMSSEPSLSVKQARKFANKILGFCDRIEKKRG